MTRVCVWYVYVYVYSVVYGVDAVDVRPGCVWHSLTYTHTTKTLVARLLRTCKGYMLRVYIYFIYIVDIQQSVEK
ncbi:hypothetical protein BC939DRAFT_433730 [Gamsiella multidivaricata]|uniref:uncharacterized protein n=1 Tax=Gamsiella multidivaricata TaxID=101098 RepID=UPI00221F8278|nr:uncharacterized protein BC939DRAFT_433730 [Gamsiella multidivaricata]KAI7832552.1 hypothetical protein BC939DRAFT_433730 [Gamsiella multidivaricata]